MKSCMCGPAISGTRHPPKLFRLHVRPEGFAVPDPVDLVTLDVEANGLEPGLGKLHRQRQTDIAEADYPQPCGPVAKTCDEILTRSR